MIPRSRAVQIPFDTIASQPALTSQTSEQNGVVIVRGTTLTRSRHRFTDWELCAMPADERHWDRHGISNPPSSSLGPLLVRYLAVDGRRVLLSFSLVLARCPFLSCPLADLRSLYCSLPFARSCSLLLNHTERAYCVSNHLHEMPPNAKSALDGRADRAHLNASRRLVPALSAARATVFPWNSLTSSDRDLQAGRCRSSILGPRQDR
jgi:hypothetical protein